MYETTNNPSSLIFRIFGGQHALSLRMNSLIRDRFSSTSGWAKALELNTNIPKTNMLAIMGIDSL